MFPERHGMFSERTDELNDDDTSMGTIRFAADKPLPTAPVRNPVKSRIAENGG